MIMIAWIGLAAMWAAFALASQGGSALAGQAGTGDSATSKRQIRHRRIIYNDDGGEVRNMRTPDIQACLAQRVVGLVGSHVDTVFYCGHDDFAKVFYKSQVPGVEFSGAAGLAQAFEQGIDPNRELIEYCRKNGMEVFWSFRMNDVHDSFDHKPGKFKREHPQWLLGKADGKYPHRSIRDCIWSSLDFAVPEVRDHVFACIAEVLGKYDVDGAEFDYGRNASLFRPTFEERPVEKEHLDTLNEFQRRLRKLGQETARKRNRPFLLAAVVPETVKHCRNVGIDVETWAREGLVDLLIAGNGYVPFSMAAIEIIELGHKHGIPVYPRLNVNTGDRLFWRHVEAWRGAAANFWQAGADGIYLFNAFDAKIGNQPITEPLRELGDPQELAGMDKLYAVDLDLSKISFGFGDVYFYMPREHLLPMSLAEPGNYAQFYVGEDLASAREKGLNPRLTLRLRVDGLAGGSAPSFLLNDRQLTDGKVTERGQNQQWFEYALEPSQVLQGTNKIAGRIQKAADAQGLPPVLARAELWVRYK